MLTTEDRLAIVYFWQEKGDLRRWTSWDEKREDIQEEFHFLIQAHDQYVLMEELIDKVVEDIKENTPI
jgi:hypothetical protein